MDRARYKLKFIEIRNFKSYRGFHRVGPLKNFSAVVGPNGSGKSNLMDAVSFVMGEKAQLLRVSRLNELVSGASDGHPVEEPTAVTAIFQTDNESEELQFTRTILRSSSVYQFGGVEVSFQEYLHRLQNLGINIKSKNFLVFQGAVESIAMKNGKEMTAFFEEISGSRAFKNEYDRLKEEMQQAEEKVVFAMQRKKLLVEERKQAKAEKDEADRYEKLRNELKEKKKILYLFQLYYCEHDIQRCTGRIVKKLEELDKLEKQRYQLGHAKSAKSKKLEELKVEVSEMDKNIRKMDSEMDKNRPSFIGAKERVVHLQKKIDSAKKSLAQARKVLEAHVEDIQHLERELAEREKQKAEHEIPELLDSTGAGQGSICLHEEQAQQYYRLKEETGRRSAVYLTQLEALNRERKLDENRLENEKRIRDEIENDLNRSRRELDQTQKRLEKLSEFISATIAALNEQKEMEGQLAQETVASKELIQSLKTKLMDVTQQLAEADLSTHEENRSLKKRELVEELKGHYGGVYGRIVELCWPSRAAHKLAVAKLLEKHMDAIVVDTEDTAQLCIRYLKEHRCPPETFLPLDTLNPSPLKERLRTMQDEFCFWLAYDLIDCKHPEIDKALLYVTNNALICDTQEDAMRVAYELIDGKRYDAVALDGTHYQKNGVISGGSRDLARKVARWNEKTVERLRTMKEKLEGMLQKTENSLRKESELQIIRLQINGLEKRLSLAENDKTKTEEQVARMKVDIEKLETKLNSLGEDQEHLNAMNERDARIQEIKNSMNAIEDEMFAEFCEQIGVPNIRHYEEGGLRNLQDRLKEVRELQNHIELVKKRLEFEKSRDMQSNVDRWERCITSEEEALKEAQKVFQKLVDEMSQRTRRIEALKSDKTAKAEELENVEEEIAKISYDKNKALKGVQEGKKVLDAVEKKLDQKKAERHDILQQAKLADVDIPMKGGDMKDVEVDGADNATQSESVNSSCSTQPSTQTIYERESKLVIDYDGLEEKHKDLFDEDERLAQRRQLQNEIEEIAAFIMRIPAPNLKAAQKLEATATKLEEVKKECDATRISARKVKKKFLEVKQQRLTLFTDCFKHICGRVDGVYKAMNQSNDASAVLTGTESDEPFCGEIAYCCMVPGKPCRQMITMSGGEKTVASLSLLFACRSYKPAPFFFLDEIDAALDPANLSKVAAFIRSHLMQTGLQIFIISLKNSFYSYADALIGVYPEDGEPLSSKTLFLGLDEYQPHPSQQTARQQ